MNDIGSIGFIGGGNMAEALLKGLLKGAIPAERMLVSDPLEQRRSVLSERYQVRVTADNRQVVQQSDILVLAIKPQLLTPVMAELALDFTPGKLLVSILAGVDTPRLEEPLPHSPRVVRAMPNTPSLVGEGATAICAGRFASGDDLNRARHLFEAVGQVHLVSEAQLDAVTGLSGSGPAYVFTIIEALADGGVREGLPRDIALALATQTVLGAATLVQDSGEHPAVLRDRVCSPGGTTIAAVEALEERGLRAALIEAVRRASARSRELGGR